MDLAQAGHLSEMYTLSSGTSSANQICTFWPVVAPVEHSSERVPGQEIDLSQNVTPPVRGFPGPKGHCASYPGEHIRRSWH